MPLSGGIMSATDTPQRLSADVSAGEFILLKGETFLVIDVEVSREAVTMFITRADVDTNSVQVMKLPFVWISVVAHPRLPHHALYLGD